MTATVGGTMNTEPLNGVGAVVFDAYGTLFDTGAAARRCQDALGDRADRLAEVWREKQVEYIWMRSLMRRFSDFWHVTGEALDYAMARLSIADPVLRARLMQAYLSLDAFPEAVDVLGDLRARGFKTAVLSNGSMTMLTAALKASGLLDRIDAVLSVDQVRVYKPAPEVYQLACDRFGLTPGQIAFVSANAWDAAGAAVFGLRSIWINRRGLPPEALPEARVDVVIDGLTTLPPVFKST